MSEASVRAQLVAALNGVSGVGVVHDYERWAVDWSKYLDLFVTTVDGSKIVRGWTVSCAGWSQDFGKRQYVYKIRGRFGLDDARASEKDAIALVENVANALNTMSDTDDSVTAQLDVFEPRLFGSVLCHYAELTVRVTMSEVVT